MHKGREFREAKAAPLSYEQEQLWFLQQLMPEMPFDNECRTVTLRGQLDVDALRKGLAAFIQRHEIWRTRHLPASTGNRCSWCRRTGSGHGRWRT